MNQSPWRDPIVEEIHRFREEYAKKFDYRYRNQSSNCTRTSVEASRYLTITGV